MRFLDIRRTIVISVVLLLPAQAEADRQVVIGKALTGTVNSSNRHSYILGGSQWNANVATGEHDMPAAGRFHHLRVEMSGSPGASKSYTFQLLKNGSTTDVSCQISDSATSCEDLDGEAIFSVTDQVTLRSVPSGTPTSGLNVTWSVVFQADDPSETFLAGGTGSASCFFDSATPHLPLSGANCHTTEFEAEIPLNQNANFSNLYASVNRSPGAGTSYTFTLMDDSASTSLACTISDTSTTCNDTSNTVFVSANSEVYIQVTNTGAPTDRNTASFSVKAEPTPLIASVQPHGEFFIPMSTDDTMNNSATEYARVLGADETYSTTQGNHDEISNDIYLIKGISVEVDDDPGITGAPVPQWEFDLMVNGSAVSCDCVISGTATTCTDTCTEYIDDDDLLATRIVPTTSPDAAKAHITYWGFSRPRVITGTP